MAENGTLKSNQMGLSEKTQALGSAAGCKMPLGAMPRAGQLGWMEPVSNEPCVKGFLDIFMEKIIYIYVYL